MTKEEILVIIAATAIFIFFNIIMWTFISIKNKIERQKENSKKQKGAENTVEDIKDEAEFLIVEDIVIVHTDERI